MTRTMQKVFEFVVSYLSIMAILIIVAFDVAFFSTNPWVILTIAFLLTLTCLLVSKKAKLLMVGALGGALLVEWVLLPLSSVIRSMFYPLAVLAITITLTCFMLHPQMRRRFTRGIFFPVSFTLVAFLGSLIILASFLGPHPFIRVSGIQTAFADVISPNNKKLLLDYAQQINDPIGGMNYLELLNWTRRHLTWGSLTHKTLSVEILKIGRGACEDYAWVYIGLLVANNYAARLILDCSFSLWPVKEAGNHVWVEVFINKTWMPIDPSVDPSYGVNNPYLYARGWNKAINHIYAITENEILDVTPAYIPPP